MLETLLYDMTFDNLRRAPMRDGSLLHMLMLSCPVMVLIQFSHRLSVIVPNPYRLNTIYP